ncbi:TMTC4 protein, partial [Polypterus senegalus]|nr:TMTC4 protein [Polypterus senegalus]
MVQQAPRLERHLIAPQLSRNQAKAIVGLAAFFCFANSFDGDFVFDDSEAIVNNKVSVHRIPVFLLLSIARMCEHQIFKEYSKIAHKRVCTAQLVFFQDAK